MKILVTGAKGFVGKNLCASLKNLRDKKDRTRPDLFVEEIYEYDVDTETSLLDEYCSNCDFVFNLAGVNRPENAEEFMQGNFGFASELLDTLKKHNNTCPVMISSSIQATCIGRYDSDYGRSKKAGEDLVFDYGKETGAKVLVYRFMDAIVDVKKDVKYEGNGPVYDLTGREVDLNTSRKGVYILGGKKVLIK